MHDSWNNGYCAFCAEDRRTTETAAANFAAAIIKLLPRDMARLREPEAAFRVQFLATQAEKAAAMSLAEIRVLQGSVVAWAASAAMHKPVPGQHVSSLPGQKFKGVDASLFHQLEQLVRG